MSLTITLKHDPNPDIPTGYWKPAKDGVKQVHLQSIRDASKKCLNYIKRNGLGAGNWTGGQIYQDGKQIAQVSYNGRVWEGAEDWTSTTKELELCD